MKNILRDAISTKSIEKQNKYSLHNSMRVRRNLALNKTLDKNIANNLVFDSTVNVSYVAMNNKNSTKVRKFRDCDVAHVCVSCNVDVLYNDCDSCNT